jgi:hypothetical protein
MAQSKVQVEYYLLNLGDRYNYMCALGYGWAESLWWYQRILSRAVLHTGNINSQNTPSVAISDRNYESRNFSCFFEIIPLLESISLFDSNLCRTNVLTSHTNWPPPLRKRNRTTSALAVHAREKILQFLTMIRSTAEQSANFARRTFGL